MTISRLALEKPLIQFFEKIKLWKEGPEREAVSSVDNDKVIEKIVGAHVEFDVTGSDKGVDVIKLAREGFGLQVKIADMPRGVYGAIAKLNDSSYGIYAKRSDNKLRQRFTFAHELAHCILHKDDLKISNGEVLRENILYRSDLSDKYEMEANELAAHILMPIAMVVNEASKESSDVGPLAKKFNVSKTAMMVRLGMPFLA